MDCGMPQRTARRHEPTSSLHTVGVVLQVKTRLGCLGKITWQFDRLVAFSKQVQGSKPQVVCADPEVVRKLEIDLRTVKKGN